eukprot:6203728-Pleurochrysis_carterae.AAC.2
MPRASDKLKDGPAGPFWHLVAPERNAPQGSGGGRHAACPAFGMKYDGTYVGAYFPLPVHKLLCFLSMPSWFARRGRQRHHMIQHHV